MSAAKQDRPHSALPGEAPQFKVVSHSNLFYWWPVWSVGFVMAGLSFFGGDRLAIVPEGTTVKAATDGQSPERYELTVPKQPTEALRQAAATPPGQEAFPQHISPDRVLGLIYTVVLLVVALATGVTLRGLWSVVNVMAIVLLVLLFTVLHWWGPILEEVGRLHIYESAAAYFVPSAVLLVYWVVTVFIFDQRRFIIFSPGQLIVHREVGDQQQVYDTGSVNVVKRLNDFVRHRLLGLGAGDLLVSADGRFEFELPNVLFADRTVRQIAEVMRTRPVVSS